MSFAEARRPLICAPLSLGPYVVGNPLALCATSSEVQKEGARGRGRKGGDRGEGGGDRDTRGGGGASEAPLSCLFFFFFYFFPFLGCVCVRPVR